MSFDDELGEICLQSLETFLLKCPAEITPYIDQIIGVALKSLKYDPNYHDEEEEDEEDEDGDVKMNGDGDDLNMDAADDDEEEDDDDDGFGESYSDDEDQSWKVRRASSKLLAAIISTHPQLLSSFANDNIMHKTVAPTLISRFKEREESVRIDILNTVVCLIRMSGITSSSSSTSKDTAARSANELSDTNR